MSGDAEIGSSRPRPLSGGFWTLLSWLRREDHSSSNESLSSAGSDRTAVSFAFLPPANYRSAPPVVVPPPGPPTDTYKQRVRERNLRRQYDRGITLHRKYGLFRGEGFNGYDALTLPTRRSQGIAGDRQERERRATSEYCQRRAAHVPGKRKAPPPPVRVLAHCNSLTPTLAVNNRRSTRKRPAPQPPDRILNVSKENIIHNNKSNLSISALPVHGDTDLSTNNNIATDPKPGKYTKKDNQDRKAKSEKSFLKQIFDNKKRTSTIDINTVKLLPSISELDAQAVEIIENNKLNKTEAITQEQIMQAVKESLNCCTKCSKRPCICKSTTMSLISEDSRNKNASTYTQTENILRRCDKNKEIDEKQKLKEMLKEMKDSLPKKPKHDNVKVANNHPNTSASSKMFNQNMNLIEAPTLRIGSVSLIQETNKFMPSSSSQITQTTRKKDEIRNVTSPPISTGNKANQLSATGVGDHKPHSSGVLKDNGTTENKKLHTPLKISSLLNPIYIPKDATCSINVSKNTSGNKAPEVTKLETTLHTNIETANAVREIVLNTALKKNSILSPAPKLSPSKASPHKGDNDSGGASCSKSQTPNIINASHSNEKKEEHSNVGPLSQHLRRRELVNQLEQSIAKGDERAAAEAASKLAQLKLSCSVLSFTSHILSQPSTSNILSDKNIQPNKTEISKHNVTHDSKKTIASTTTSSTKSNDMKNVVNDSMISTEKNQGDGKNTTSVTSSIQTNKMESASPHQASTSKGLSPGGSNLGIDNVAIDVWVEDKEKARGPIKLLIRRAARVGDLRRQAEQSLGLPTRLQRWIVGRNLCTSDDVLLASLAGPSLNVPFYLCLVESDANVDQVNIDIPNESNNMKGVDILRHDEEKKKSSDVYTELVQLERQALVPNAEVFECEICMEQCKSGDGVVLRECVHSFCKSCLSDLIRHCEEPAVSCPAMGCPGELHEREIRALVSPEEYEKWLARGLAAAESGTRNAFHCRTRDCTGWALCEVGVQKFPCPVCKHTNCVPCQAIHENESCEQHRAKLKAAAATKAGNETDQGTQALIDSLIERGEALQCPECSAIITKKWGCDWVKCSACKTEICWVTRGRRWGPGGRGDTSGGCKCGVDGKRCHPSCGYCH